MGMNSLEVIRRNPKMYLGLAEVSRFMLATRLAEYAFISGARRLQLQAHRDDWMSVAADEDWISPNLESETSVDRAFLGMMPLKGGRINEIRFEVVVTAFSEGVALKRQCQWIHIYGQTPPTDLTEGMSHANFVVLFKAETKTFEP